MGTFMGHAIPGTFFFAFGLWHVLHILYRFCVSRLKNTAFRATATHNSRCCRAKEVHCEGFVKMLCCFVGIIGETVTAFDKSGRFAHLSNAQHIMMFSLFAINGLADVLLHYKVYWLPADTNYVTLVLALLGEGLLFNYHLEGREELDIHVHTLLVVAVFACILAVLAEAKFRHNVSCSLARGYFLMLQGSWFWQVGFILYPPASGATAWENTHDNRMVATMCLAWHGTAIALLLLFLAGVMRCILGPLPHSAEQLAQGSSLQQLIQHGANGQTLVALNDDSETELEREPLTGGRESTRTPRATRSE